MTPRVGDRAGGSAGCSDPTDPIALDRRLTRARAAHREALRAVRAAAVAIERAKYELDAAWRAADVSQSPTSYSHLPPASRAEPAELAELNARATSVVLSRGV